MIVSRFAVALLVFIVAAPPLGAQVPASHDHKAAVEHKPSVAELAARGDGDAQYQMGLAALGGAKKVRKDAGAALMWFGLAAFNGNAAAAVDAARLFETNGDMAAAARWWYRAGQLGDHLARDRFLERFVNGDIPGLGGLAGASWLAERAEAGDRAAVLALGDAFAFGREVPVDLAWAERWYAEAALSGDVEGMFRLGRLDLFRPAQWRAPSKETDHDGHWQGPVYWPLRAQARDKDSGEYDLGRKAEAGELDIDPKLLSWGRPGMVQAEYWLREAAERGHVGAQALLGQAYLDGTELPLDVVGAASLLQAAGSAGHVGALERVAMMAAKGQGFPGGDPVRAWVSLDLAAALGDGEAAAERDHFGSTIGPRVLARARQMAQDIRALRFPVTAPAGEAPTVEDAAPADPVTTETAPQ